MEKKEIKIFDIKGTIYQYSPDMDLNEFIDVNNIIMSDDIDCLEQELSFIFKLKKKLKDMYEKGQYL